MFTHSSWRAAAANFLLAVSALDLGWDGADEQIIFVI